MDQLGSTRLVTDASGVVTERHDYMPFGEELFAGVGGRNTGQGYAGNPIAEGGKPLFTGKYRDNDSNMISSAMPDGLDYSQYRYSSSAQGRWTSPDPLPGWPSDPQSWNRYAYVRNNPLKYRDPLGLTYEVCDQDGKNCSKLDDIVFEKERKTSQKNGEYFSSNGSLFHYDANGNKIADGTYKHIDIESQNGPALVSELGKRADAQLGLIGVVAGGSAALGTGVGAFTGLAGVTTVTTTVMSGGEAIGVEGLTADEMALVSRWGRSGLTPGDWVMRGGTGIATYLGSFKWEPSSLIRRFGNAAAPFTSGQNFLVPKSTIQAPGGWEFFKALFGQGVYKP